MLFRALKAALRVELRTHGAVADKWGFLGDGVFSNRAHRLRVARAKPRG